MTLSRWLSLSVFALAVVAAWQLAQPDAQSAPQAVGSPVGNPFSDAACTSDVGKPQPVLTLPETRKISVDFLQQ